MATEDVTFSPTELAKMIALFGEKVNQMGQRQHDGSMLVPIGCVIEAARSLGIRALSEAAESFSNDEKASQMQSGEALVDRVIEARNAKLRGMTRAFQNEADDDRSNRRWAQIEKEVFGVDYRD